MFFSSPKRDSSPEGPSSTPMTSVFICTSCVFCLWQWSVRAIGRNTQCDNEQEEPECASVTRTTCRKISSWWEWLRPLVTSINSIKLAVSNSFQLSLSLFICHLFLISSVSLSLLITLSLVSDVSYSILSRSSLISLLSLFISINHHEHSVWYVCNVFVCCVLRGAGWCCVLWCFVRCEICVVYSFVTPLRLLWLVLSLSLSLSFSLSLIFQQPLQ